MSTSKSFWSGIPVVAKAIGGIVTAVVGLGSLLVALGVIGNSNSTSPTATTVPSSGTPGTAGGTTRPGTVLFTVDPSSLTLKPLENKKVVTVTNHGTSALTVDEPVVSGTDKDRFGVASDCDKVAVGGSCEITVTLNPGGDATATMTVSADGAAASEKVALIGTLL